MANHGGGGGEGGVTGEAVLVISIQLQIDDHGVPIVTSFFLCMAVEVWLEIIRDSCSDLMIHVLEYCHEVQKLQN